MAASRLSARKRRNTLLVLLSLAFVAVGLGNYAFTLGLAHLLAPDAFGVAMLVQSFLLFASWFASSGFPWSTARRMSGLADRGEQASVLRGALYGNLILATVLGALLLASLALGTLKAFPKSARLRLERIGGVEVLLVDGERCWGEEEKKLLPGIEAARARGIQVEGPLPADTLFFRAGRGDFDLVVAMYHDQGHGPVKVLGLEAGVNITVGLPFVRTSVDHGTAFDIAGSGKADERSLIQALRDAVALAPKTRPGASA